MNKKILILLTLLLIPIILSVPQAHATTTYAYYRPIAENDVNDGEAPLTGVHPSIGADRSGHGIMFNSSANGWLSSISLVILNVDSYVTNGNLQCKIYGLDGTFGTDSYLNTTVLATAEDYVLIESLQRGVAWGALGANATTGEVTFTFDRSYFIKAKVAYGIGITVQSAVGIDTSNMIGFGQCAFNSTIPTYHSEYISGIWDYDGETGAGLSVIVDSEEGSATPLPIVWGDLGTSDQALTALMSFIVPLLVMLMPVGIFVLLFRKTDKWLILIGLAIGTGLGFYFGMVPAWLVFLVAIGLIGMAYQSVRGGG